MSKKTLALIAGLTVLTLVLVVIALTTGQKQPSQKQSASSEQVTSPKPTIPAHTSVSLAPNPVILTAGKAEVQVMIDSSDNLIAGVQFDVVYDPQVFNLVDIKQGTFLTKPLILLNEIDRTTGRATYALSLTPANIRNPNTGSGVLATVTLAKKSTAPSTGSSPLALENVVISAMNPNLKETIPGSVLKSTKGTSVTLTNTASGSGTNR